jgi:hypothetical protein
VGDCDHSSSGWTYETLRIHLMAVMDERKEASKDAVKTALEAVRTDQARSVALSDRICGQDVALCRFKSTERMNPWLDPV